MSVSLVELQSRHKVKIFICCDKAWAKLSYNCFNEILLFLLIMLFSFIRCNCYLICIFFLFYNFHLYCIFFINIIQFQFVLLNLSFVQKNKKINWFVIHSNVLYIIWVKVCNLILYTCTFVCIKRNKNMFNFVR